MNATLIDAVSTIVTKVAGIQLGPKQAAMVESRMLRRMLQLGIGDAEIYLTHLKNNSTSETQALVSLLTTHHTHFFREFMHFEFLETQALPALIPTLRREGRNTLRVWSAASSRGQEVYSLSMFLHAHLKKMAPDFKYEIMGSDVDGESVSIAKNGVYRYDEIKSIPAIYGADHWIRGSGEIADFVKAKASIRMPCSFETVNLLDFEAPMKGRTFDIILCRNVFIYFNQEQIASISTNLLKHMSPYGYFFIGLSESLTGLRLPVKSLAPSVYQQVQLLPKTDALKPSVAPVVAMPTLARTIAPQILRVLCVDDSPTVLTLLKKLLQKEDGFEVVATAKNGLEATQMLKQHTVDVVTLDIHMPEQNGVEYLQKNMNPKHPPVVVVSSVSREDSGLGLKTLELGAVDYVEKPGMADLTERADEIRTKLRCAALSASLQESKGPSEVDQSFSKKFVIKNPEKKLRIIAGGLADRGKIVTLLRQINSNSEGEKPPVLILVPGSGNAITALVSHLESALGFKPELLEGVPSKDQLIPYKVYIADFAKNIEGFRAVLSSRATSIMMFRDISKKAVSRLTNWPNASFVLEDGPTTVGTYLPGRCSRIIPHTSFVYHSDEFLSGTGF
ncbi:CheR family methyltransferase [Bdellovibrionota bacterium FG-2]